MGYQPISFVAFEQPTTAKWNILGSNDASFNDGTGLNVNNNEGFNQKDFSGTRRAIANIDTNDICTLGNPNLVENAVNTRCKFHVSTSINQTIASGVPEKIDFDTEVHDVGGNFNVITGTFTTPVAGYYDLMAQLKYSNIGDGKTAFAYLNVDGTDVALGSQLSPIASADLMPQVVVLSLKIAAGKDVYIRANHNHGADRDVLSGATQTYFMGALSNRGD